MNIVSSLENSENDQYEIYLGIDFIGGRVNSENLDIIKCPTEDNRLTKMWDNITGKYTYNGYAHEKFIDINDFKQDNPNPIDKKKKQNVVKTTQKKKQGGKNKQRDRKKTRKQKL